MPGFVPAADFAGFAALTAAFSGVFLSPPEGSATVFGAGAVFAAATSRFGPLGIGPSRPQPARSVRQITGSQFNNVFIGSLLRGFPAAERGGSATSPSPSERFVWSC